MAAYVLCFTSSGGLPLFTRKQGEGNAFPFSIVASLNGVHMFSKSQDVDLISTCTKEMSFAWREMEKSVIIIAAACGVSSALLEQLLISVFNSMVLVVGLEEIRSCRNIERLKRDLRICYPVIDRLLECVETTSCYDLLGLSEVILCSENTMLQNLVDAFCECLGSLYGCLLVQNRIAVATPSWWSLDPNERKLLMFLVADGRAVSARDIPVFLPYTSPNVPLRLVTCTLITNVEICMLCGPSPSLSEVEHTAIQCWRGSIEMLRSAEQCYPRNFPHTVQLDPGVIGVLLVDLKCGKFMLSRNQTHLDGKKDTYRLDILCTFYHQGASVLHASGSTIASETYWCSEYHKCHALRQESTILCVLYTAAVPTEAMRLITRHTFKILTTDKQLCW